MTCRIKSELFCRISRAFQHPTPSFFLISTSSPSGKASFSPFPTSLDRSGVSYLRISYFTIAASAFYCLYLFFSFTSLWTPQEQELYLPSLYSLWLVPWLTCSNWQGLFLNELALWSWYLFPSYTFFSVKLCP